MRTQSLKNEVSLHEAINMMKLHGTIYKHAQMSIYVN